MKQGKCKPCKTIWVWDKDIPTAQAPHCRDCGGILVRTCMPALTPGDRPHSVVRRMSDGARIPWGCSAAYTGPILEEPKAVRTWYPLQRAGNYFAEEGTRILACPMNADGRRGDDSEVCDCDDQAAARAMFLEARGAAAGDGPAPTKTGQPVKRILVVDHIGNGYTVVCTLDGVVWDKYNHQPVNPYVKNQIMQRLMASDPQAEIREITSFWIEIPADWATPGCRIVG